MSICFPGDIDNMDQEDCEELYDAILDSIDDRDQAKRDVSGSVKMTP